MVAIRTSPWLVHLFFALLSWRDVLESLREVEKLLKRPMQRERFVNKCLPPGNESAEKLFRGWNISLKSLRWQQVVVFITSAPRSMLLSVSGLFDIISFFFVQLVFQIGQ